MGVPALTHNTRKTSVGEYVAKIRPAVAEQSRQKKKRKTRNKRPLKMTSPRLRLQRVAPSNNTILNINPAYKRQQTTKISKCCHTVYHQAQQQQAYVTRVGITTLLSSSLPSLFASVGSGQRHRTSSRNYASRQTLRLDVSAVSLTIIYRRRSCFSGRRRTHLERSAAARHVCTLADACFSQSSEDASLQTLFSVTPSSVFLSCL